MSDVGPSEQSATVLLADPDEERASTIRQWLTPAHDLRSAQTGVDALAWYGPEVDVAIVSRRLPDMSPTPLCETMNRRAGDDQKLLLTGSDPGSELADSPCDEFLAPPLQRERLCDAVHDLRIRSRLDDEIQEHYRLVSKIAALERSDAADTDATVEQLRSKAERLQSHIEDQVSSLEAEGRAFKLID